MRRERGRPATPPTAAVEPLPEENVSETRRPDLVSSPSPPRVSLAVPESSREEAASIAEATEKTKRKDPPAPQMGPPARAIEDVAKAIEGPASRAKTGGANHGAPSRSAPLSQPAQPDALPTEDAQKQPPALERSARELTRQKAIPVPPQKGKTPLKTPKGRRISPARWRARLSEESWGCRSLRVRLSDESHVVKFENLGSQKDVQIDGKIVVQVGATFLYTFRSKFNFTITDGGAKRRASLEYDLSFLGAIKGLSLTVENQVVYAEGSLL